MSKSVPTKQADLLAWAANANTKFVASPTTYFLAASEVTAFTAAKTAFANAMQAIADPDNKTKAAVSIKNDAKRELLRLANSYAKQIVANVAIPDDVKIGVGLHIPVQPAPIPAPTLTPVLIVKSVSGWTAKSQITYPGDTKKWPPGVKGASIFSFVGATPSPNVGDWKFEGSTTKKIFDIVFATSLAAGTRVWLTAFYFNPTSLSGPACDPVGTNLQGGGVQAMAA